MKVPLLREKPSVFQEYDAILAAFSQSILIEKFSLFLAYRFIFSFNSCQRQARIHTFPNELRIEEYKDERNESISSTSLKIFILGVLC